MHTNGLGTALQQAPAREVRTAHQTAPRGSLADLHRKISQCGVIMSHPNKIDRFLTPFCARSPHNRPIGTGAKYADSNHPAVIDFRKANFGNLNIGIPWGRVVLKNNSSMPIVTVGINRGSSGLNLPISLRMVPMTTRPPVGSNYPDCVVTVYNTVPDPKLQVDVVYGFYEFSWPPGQRAPTATYVKTFDASGTGIKCGTTASGVSHWFGLNRGHEINTDDSGEIRHVMQLMAANQSTHKSPMTLANNFVWPACSTDHHCDGKTNCSGNVPYGSLWALPQDVYTDAYIESIGLNPLGKRLARQLRNYGAYFVDGADGRPSRGDNIITKVRRSEFITQMRKIYPNLRMVINNKEDQTASGGGTQIASNAAFDA